jgi:hypothetical protein
MTCRNEDIDILGRTLTVSTFTDEVNDAGWPLPTSRKLFYSGVLLGTLDVDLPGRSGSSHTHWSFKAEPGVKPVRATFETRRGLLIEIVGRNRDLPDRGDAHHPDRRDGRGLVVTTTRTLMPTNDSSVYVGSGYGFQGKCSLSRDCNESPATYVLKTRTTRDGGKTTVTYKALCDAHAAKHQETP